jgi:hypothetical protein
MQAIGINIDGNCFDNIVDADGKTASHVVSVILCRME